MIKNIIKSLRNIFQKQKIGGEDKNKQRPSEVKQQTYTIPATKPQRRKRKRAKNVDVTDFINDAAKVIERYNDSYNSIQNEVKKIVELGYENCVFNFCADDDVSCSICKEAYKKSPMSLKKLKTKYGLPPRHIGCRCLVTGGEPEWFK